MSCVCFSMPAPISGLTSSPTLQPVHPLHAPLCTQWLYTALEHPRPTADLRGLYGRRLWVHHPSIRYSTGEVSEAPSSQPKSPGSIPGALLLPPLSLLFSSPYLPLSYSLRLKACFKTHKDFYCAHCCLSRAQTIQEQSVHQPGLHRVLEQLGQHRETFSQVNNQK